MADNKTDRDERRAKTKAKTDEKLDAIGDVLGTVGKRVEKSELNLVGLVVAAFLIYLILGIITGWW